METQSEVTIINYGMGNLHSVQKGFEKVGISTTISQDPKDILNAKRIVLPGVGAFKDCMENLNRLNLLDPILKSIETGKPYLGICLGLQILFTESDEFGPSPGLGIFPGRVRRFMALDIKIPHMGWNQVNFSKQIPCLQDISDGTFFYFVHSYHVDPLDEDIIATTTNYGIEFVSSISKDNIFACQFHPEKSQKEGLKILKNFGRALC